MDAETLASTMIVQKTAEFDPCEPVGGCIEPPVAEKQLEEFSKGKDVKGLLNELLQVSYAKKLLALHLECSGAKDAASEVMGLELGSEFPDSLLASFKEEYLTNFIASKSYRDIVRYYHASFKYWSLEKFDFLGVLGAGGFGKVWAAKVKMTGRMYAIKSQTLESSSEDERDLIFAIQDSPSPGLLNHAGSFVVDKSVFYVIQISECGTLGNCIEAGMKLKVNVLKAYLKAIAGALSFLHALGFIHRDVKPDNIFLFDNGLVKLGDFVLAIRLSTAAESGGYAGTKDYMAPEVKKKTVPYDESVDSYSLAKTMMALKGDVKGDYEAFGISSVGELLSRMGAEEMTERAKAVEVVADEALADFDLDAFYAGSTEVDFKPTRYVPKIEASEVPEGSTMIDSPFSTKGKYDDEVLWLMNSQFFRQTIIKQRRASNRRSSKHIAEDLIWNDPANPDAGKPRRQSQTCLMM